MSDGLPVAVVVVAVPFVFVASASRPAPGGVEVEIRDVRLSRSPTIPTPIPPQPRSNEDGREGSFLSVVETEPVDRVPIPWRRALNFRFVAFMFVVLFSVLYCPSFGEPGAAQKRDLQCRVAFLSMPSCRRSFPGFLCRSYCPNRRVACFRDEAVKLGNRGNLSRQGRKGEFGNTRGAVVREKMRRVVFGSSSRQWVRYGRKKGQKGSRNKERCFFVVVKGCFQKTNRQDETVEDRGPVGPIGR